jgi:hypothetical protein
MGILDLVAGPILDIVNKIIPTPMTPEQKVQAQLAVEQLAQNEEFKQIDAQLATTEQQTDTNKVEAASTSLFVAGWRPFIGWICGGTLGYTYIGSSLIDVIATAFGHPLNLPKPDMSEMMPILLGMLGLGSMRTYEKVNGINAGE